jgi:hypothetical protein
MKTIEQISLEDDNYNSLYFSLKELRSSILKVIKAQHIIDEEIRKEM